MSTPAITEGRFAAAAVLMLALAASATAQAPLSARPTETDLHAAYCTEVLKFLIEGSQSSVTLYSGPEYNTVPGPNDPPELQASKAKGEAAMREMKARLESQKAILRKIDLYLKPRIFDLDPIPIVAAKRAAQEDRDRLGSATSGCQYACPLLPDSKADDLTKCNDECAARSMPDLPTIQKKIKSCLSIEWLPF